MEEVNILVLLINEAAVEVSSRLVVSEEPGLLYRLNIPNQWLRVLFLGRVKKELVMDSFMKRRMANTTHFVGSLSNHQGCILKLGTHSPT